MQDKGDRQENILRTSGIVLDWAKRTAWATQDPSDRQDNTERKIMQGQGTDKIIQGMTMRTSGIILDRVKRTAWATQDSEDR
jgi:hypothetical protein